MKRFVMALAIALSAVSLSSADSLKIVVVPIENKAAEDKMLAKELTDDIVREIGKSGYQIVPEYTFFSNWWRSAAVGWKSDRPVPTIEEFEVRKNTEGYSIRDLFNHDMLGTAIEHKDNWGVDNWGIDLGITGEIRRRNDKGMEIYAEIISVKTGRFCYSVKQAEPSNAKDVMKKEIMSLLDKIVLIRKVEADEEADMASSEVVYNVKAKDGQIVKVRVDYASDRPNPPIKQADILPARELKEGVETYRISTKEKKDIIFDFHFKHNNLESIVVSHLSPPDTTGIEYQETLTVTSEAGYDIGFVFSWKNNEIVFVRIVPSRNPYSCEQAGKG